MFCARSVLDISKEKLIHPNLLVCSVYCFHVYFYVRFKLLRLRVSFSLEDSFKKVKNSYIKSAHFSVCDNYSVNTDETW